MMIPILTDYHEPGYLPAPRYGTLPAFFPNVNLAVRRRAAMEIGLYDEACRAGEDADLCLRAALAGWELFYEQRAAVRHEPPPSLAATARRWWWYGFSGGAVFRKAMRHRCEVYFSLEARPRIHRYRRLFAADFSPIRVLVFVSPFLLFHLGALGAAVLLALGWTAAAAGLTALLVLAAGLLHRRSPLRGLPLRDLLLYGTVTWVIDWTCIAASVAGGLRRRMIFLFPGL